MMKYTDIVRLFLRDQLISLSHNWHVKSKISSSRKITKLVSSVVRILIARYAKSKAN